MKMKVILKKTIAVLLCVCMVLPLMPQKVEATDAGLTGENMRQFITNTGVSAKTNYGDNLFDGKTLNSIMGTTGYAYLFHTNFRSTEGVMSGFDAANNPYMQVGYLGWGSKGAEQYFVGLYKNETGWSLKFHRGDTYWPKTPVAEYSLTGEQVAEIQGNGLDIFLVNSDSTTYTVCVEKEGVVDMAASLVSPTGNKVVYEIRHTSKDTEATFTTTGYFYGDGYTRATAAQSLLSAQDTDATGETHREFKNSIGATTETENFGNNLFDEKKISSIMGTTGYAYLFHTKFRSTDETMSGAANELYMQVRYDGWGSAAEQYFIGVYKNETGWSLKFHRGVKYWAQTLIAEYSLTGEQVAEIAGNGLDIFLVNSDSTTYTVYVEKEGVVDMAASLVSPTGNKQVYRVLHTSKDKTAMFTTTGYFYGDGYTRATAAQDLLETDVTPAITKADGVTLKGVKESYEAGELVAFTVLREAGCLITVTLNGEELAPDAEGIYQFLLTKKYENSCALSITSIPPAFSFLSHKSGGKVQLIEYDKENDFGNTYGNFLFHTKLKVDGLVNDDGSINYPETEKKYTIQYVGYGTSGCTYAITMMINATSASLEFASGVDGWKKPTLTMSEAQIQKLGRDGLSLYLVHSSTDDTVFDLYVEKGDGTGVVENPLKITGSANPNKMLCKIKQYGSTLKDVVTSVTTGYSFEDVYPSRKAVVDAFAELTATEIPITYTGAHVIADSVSQTCSMGDYVVLAPKVEDGCIVEKLSIGATELTCGTDGKYRLPVSLEHIKGITVDVTTASGEFTDFVTLTGASLNKHGDQKGRFIFHTVIQTDNWIVDSKNPYVEVLYSIWGSNVTENLTLRLYFTGENAGKIQIGKWCNTGVGGQQKWVESNKVLDANQLAKLKGDGLNLYMVHSPDNLLHYEVYLENGDSSDVTKACEIDVCHGEHVIQTWHNVIGEGANVTTTGYQYSADLTIHSAPSVLFWKDTAAKTGNVNDDAYVDVKDVVRGMRYADNASAVSINTRAGDSDGDHVITLQDISNICQKVLLSDKGIELDYYDNLDNQTNKTSIAFNQKLFYDNNMRAGYIAGADPSVMEITKAGDKNQGKYVMMVTGNAANQTIPVYLSADLVNWKEIGKINIVDESGQAATLAANKDIWAMEMVYDEKEQKYYLFFSATPEAQITDSAIQQVPYVAVGDSYTGNFQLITHEDYKYADGSGLSQGAGSEVLGYAAYLKYALFDPYKIGQRLTVLKEQGLVDYATERAFQAIDLHPFVDDDGKKYLYFSLTGGDQVIMGVEMDNWTTPRYDTLTVLTQNQKDAVINGQSVAMERNNTNEGPWMTKHNGKYYLTFSINGYGTDNYKVLQAVADEPLGAFRKLSVEEGGILIGADRIGEISGPGHHSLIEKNGEMYIIYHAHRDPAAPSYKRYVAVDKVEWITNGNGLEVMYVNGPTKTSVQPLPEFATGYKNVAPLATVTATNIKSGSTVTGLTDKVWNSKGGTWKGQNSGTSYIFGDNFVKDVEFGGNSVITMTFENPVNARAIMIYNSSDISKAFDSIDKIEFVGTDGRVKCITNLGFNTAGNTYTFADYQGVVTGDNKFICGASVAEFNEIDVNEIRITMKAGEGKTDLAIGEIVVLGKTK